MMAEAVQKHDKFADIYLKQLQTLASEMNVAMNAIAGNALSTLEESVAKQEMLCASLATMADTVQKELRSSEGQLLPAQLDSSVALKIQATGGAIRNLNLQYASLLKHSGRSVALLSALCKSHTGQAQEAHGSRLKQQTWSCEM